MRIIVSVREPPDLQKFPADVWRRFAAEKLRGSRRIQARPLHERAGCRSTTGVRV